MKNLTVIPVILAFVLLGCSRLDLDREIPISVPKISEMTVIEPTADTTVYSFQYTGEQLTTVLRNNLDYANLIYHDDRVEVITKFDFTNFSDTFVAYIKRIPDVNIIYIDSIYNRNTQTELAMNVRQFYSKRQPINNKLLKDSEENITRYIEGNGVYPSTSVRTFNYIRYLPNSFNIASLQFMTSLPFDRGGEFFIYNTNVNQPNLPDQFITNFQSYYSIGRSIFLTPTFLLQQSNIFPYRKHDNLVSSWSKISTGSFPGVMERTILYDYSYTYDSDSRVTQMNVSMDRTLLYIYKFQYL